MIEERAWGKFEVLVDHNNYKVKKITVNPGHRLSYQSHKYRSELWHFVSGEGEVTLEGKISRVIYDDSVRIPAESKHRISNTGTESLVFIEIQTGKSFEEEDIIRYEDDYGRA